MPSSRGTTTLASSSSTWAFPSGEREREREREREVQHPLFGDNYYNPVGFRSINSVDIQLFVKYM